MTKLAVKNEIEKRMPDLRLRIQELPKVARQQPFETLTAKIFWLERDLNKLRYRLYEIENQQELEV